MEGRFSTYPSTWQCSPAQLRLGGFGVQEDNYGKGRTWTSEGHGAVRWKMGTIAGFLTDGYGGKGGQETKLQKILVTHVWRGAATLTTEGTVMCSLRLVTNDHQRDASRLLLCLQRLTPASASMATLPSSLAPSLAALTRAIVVAMEPISNPDSSLHIKLHSHTACLSPLRRH